MSLEDSFGVEDDFRFAEDVYLGVIVILILDGVP